MGLGNVGGDMWSFQKPDFAVLLLAELQRQQQCSQFCDILLKAEDVSVPAHSCILSAISPLISQALSSAPPPPTGQKRLLEFKTLGACTMLHLVRLLYSGEILGDGESEKHNAVSAAAKLGIHGLEEVTDKKSDGRPGLRHYAEAGVQTEPLTINEKEVPQSRWRREIRDGNTFLWKEPVSEAGSNVWTQTEDLLVTASATNPLNSSGTIEISAVQSLPQADRQCVPVTLFYPPNDNQSLQLSSTSVAPESISLVPQLLGTPSTSHFSSLSLPGTTGPQISWVTSNVEVTATEESEDEQFEQFQGNIPGFIKYFMDQNIQEGKRRPRGRPRMRGGAGLSRAGPERSRRPRGRVLGRGMGRGGRWTHLVDVQDVGVGKRQRLYLQRWGMRTPRAGQGGGAIGRKLCLQTRDNLKPARRGRRGGGQMWEQSSSLLLSIKGGGDGTPHQWKDKKLFADQESPGVYHIRGTRNKSKSDPANVFPSPGPSRPAKPDLPHSTSQSETPILHTLPLPPHEDQHIERLLEEVMMGLEILPNNTSTPAQFPCPRATSSGTQTAPRSQDVDPEMPVLEQQVEGNLNAVLDNLLASFEKHVGSCCSREDNETHSANTSVGSEARSTQRKLRRATAQGRNLTQLQDRQEPGPVSGAQTDKPKSPEPLKSKSAENPSQSSEVSAVCGVSPERTKASEESARKRNRRRAKAYLFSLEKKKTKIKKVNVSSDAHAASLNDQRDNQPLQNTPVDKEKRRLTPQRPSCQKSEFEVKKVFLSGKSLSCNLSGISKTYPIRSRIREVLPKEVLPVQVPLPKLEHRGRGRPKKKPEPVSSANKESLKVSKPVNLWTSCLLRNHEKKEKENHQRQREGSLTAQPRKDPEVPKKKAKKRKSKPQEEKSGPASKKLRIKHIKGPTPTPGPENASPEEDEVIDVETISVSTNLIFAKTENKVESNDTPVFVGELSGSEDEIIDVEGDQDAHKTFSNHVGRKKPREKRRELKKNSDMDDRSHPDRKLDIEYMETQVVQVDSDIDVVGDESPYIDPVSISWTHPLDRKRKKRSKGVGPTSVKFVSPAIARGVC